VSKYAVFLTCDRSSQIYMKWCIWNNGKENKRKRKHERRKGYIKKTTT